MIRKQNQLFGNLYSNFDFLIIMKNSGQLAAMDMPLLNILSLNIRSLAKTKGPCSVVHFITTKPHEPIVCSVIITTAYAETLT